MEKRKLTKELIESYEIVIQDLVKRNKELNQAIKDNKHSIKYFQEVIDNCELVNEITDTI